jgi:zinc and cadmium transporter
MLYNIDMNAVLAVLSATFLISLGALIGAFTLSSSKKLLNRVMLWLVSLSAGTMMGGAFFHLLPEALEDLPVMLVMIVVVLAYFAFLVMESLMHWHHCHQSEPSDHDHTLGYMNLFGDGVHNFIDGLIIAGAFLTSFELGVVTTIAVALHEIPQEISDFGVLMFAGFKRNKALLLNLISGLMTVVGGIVGILAAGYITNIVPYLLAIAAGGFIYISTTDLVPQINDQNKLDKAAQHISIFVLGLVITLSLLLLE